MFVLPYSFIQFGVVKHWHCIFALEVAYKLFHETLSHVLGFLKEVLALSIEVFVSVLAGLLVA